MLLSTSEAALRVGRVGRVVIEAPHLLTCCIHREAIGFSEATARGWLTHRGRGKTRPQFNWIKRPISDISHPCRDWLWKDT
jgi:hypothetical protein